MALDTNLNVAPYFDDFDELKNYHRILFKPSNAVQTRELNTLQSIIQNQIERFGNQVFKDGAALSGCTISILESLDYVRVNDHGSGGALINVSDYNGKIVESNATGLRASIYTTKGGTEIQWPYTNRLYIQYLNSGVNADGSQVQRFQPNEALTVFDLPRTANVALTTVNTFISSTNSNTYVTLGVAAGVKIDSGIIYQKGFFIRSDAQTLVVSDTVNAGNCVVGFATQESIITAEQDDSLYDNALGYSNPTAPGADRLKLTPTLKVIGADDISTIKNFTPLVQYYSGIPAIQNPDDRYSAIGSAMQRVSDETNGSFVIKPFKVSTSSGNSTFINAQVSPGSGYAQGNRVELLKQIPVAIKRGIDTVVAESQVVTSNYGNYILVNEMVGVFDFTSAQQVTLYDTAQQACSRKTFSNTGVAGNAVGVANLRCVKINSGIQGSPTAVYEFYLFNIRMNAGKNFATNVKSIVYTGSGSRGIADAILTNGQNTLLNSERKLMVYNFGSSAVKTLKDGANNINSQYILRQRSTSTLSSNGQIGLTLTTSHAGGINQFPYGLGVLGSLENEFIIVTHSATQTAAVSNVSVSGATMTGSGFLSRLSPQEYVLVGSDIRRVVSVNSDTSVTVDAAFSAANSAIAYAKYFPAGYTFPLTDSMVGTRTITVTSPTSLTINTGTSVAGALTNVVDVSIYHNILRYNAVPSKKSINKNSYVVIDTSTHPAGNIGPWSLGLTDVHEINSVKVDNTVNVNAPDSKSSFYFDTGMRDTHYDTAMIYLRPGMSIPANSKILVSLDVFTLNTTTGIGFFSVDSYPIDDNNSANNNAITTANIPVYTSESGAQFSLRDCVDFRPYKTNSATVTANVASASVNPGTTQTFVTDTVGLYPPSVDQNFETDLTFYVGRKDIIYFSNKGYVKVKQGAPAVNPVTPKNPEDGMSIAVMNIPPFPSLSSDENSDIASVNRTVVSNIRNAGYMIGGTIVTNKRYRMQDIGTLDQRISRLEYYNALNLLEQATTSLQVPDANGLDRFKNGIFVDPFNDFTLSDVSNPEFRIALDAQNSLIRPFFRQQRPELQFDLASSTSVVKTGRLVTLPFNRVVVARQPYATDFRSAAAVEFRWTGQIQLYPNYGHNIDTKSDPAINVSLDLSTPWQQFANSPFGQVWGDWRVTGQSSTSATSLTGVTDNGATLTNNYATTTTTTTTSSRAGTQAGVNTNSTTYNLGTFIDDISIQPYIASAEIGFYAFGMRPSTKLYAYFDDVAVDSQVAMGVRNTSVTDTSSTNYVTRTADYGSGLTTDANGTCYGKFLIPASTFRTGERSFKLCDVQNVKIGKDAVTTSATATYTASNFTVTTQTSTLTTVNPELTFSGLSQASSSTQSSTSFSSETVPNPSYVPPPPPPSPTPQPQPDPTPVYNPEEPNVAPTPAQIPFVPADPPPTPQPANPFANGGFGAIIDDPRLTAFMRTNDPLAQILRINVDNSVTGCFLTGIDIFFQGKPSVDMTVGCSVFIVENFNGYPNSTRMLPFTRTHLNWNQITTSNDGTVPTHYEFEAPVFVNNNTTYSVIIFPDGGNPDYKVWTAVLGNNDVATGTQVSSKPYTDPCLMSSNIDTWSPVQDTYVKFNLYRASFSSQRGTAGFVSSPRETFKLSTIVNSSNTLSVMTSDRVFGVDANNNIVLAANAVVSDFDVSNNVIGAVNSSGTFSGLPKIQMHRLSADGATPTANTLVATGTVASIQDIPMNTLVPRFATMEPSGTAMTYSFKAASNTYVPDAVAIPCTVDVESELLDYPRIVASRSNEVNFAGGAHLLTGAVSLKTDSEFLSPAIDTVRSNILAVENIIDPSSFNLTQEYTNSGAVKNKYVSKVITLAAGQDSEDLRVYLTAFKPFSSKIAVFAKFLNGEDAESIVNKSWTPLTIDDDTVFSDYRNVNDYRELMFTTPTAIPSGAPATTAYVDPANGLTYTSGQGGSFTSYKSFQLKIVLLSDSTCLVPRVNDVRALAILL